MKTQTNTAIPRLLPWVAAISTAFSLGVLAGPEIGSGAVSFPDLNFKTILRSKDAQLELALRVKELAAAYGWTDLELITRLLIDRNLALDFKGRLHYTETAPEAAAGVESAGPVADIPQANAFALHSQTGANRTIYLDFNGHVISGTGWNTSYNGGTNIVAPPFDLDGAPTTFNTAERNVIIETWLRVSEDYAPFDVDVTTELASEDLLTRSSTSDLVFGTRVLISPISQYFGNYGGVAYVGSFDDVGNTYKPALVFPERLANSGKNIGEAATHECGHNLGLNHDGTATAAYYSGHGTGDTGWAPIMGAGYTKNVTQWSRGEYSGANNTQDDLAVINLFGLPTRADDHGNTAATASPLDTQGGVWGSGVIERNTDVDVHSFTLTASSDVTVNVGPAAVGPDLDVLAELRDASGVLLGTSNPTSALVAAFTGTLNAGTYYLSLRGTGAGDPLTTGYTAYGSLGQYTITGSISAPNQPPVAVLQASSIGGSTPMTYVFDGSQSADPDGSIGSYAWYFGDGTTGSGSSLGKTYAAAGTYTVTLTVTDNVGAKASTSQVILVTAPNQNPVAAVTATPTSGTAPLAVAFSGSGSSDPDGSISAYSWNFGDGTTGTGVNASKSYSAAGTYTAVLTVTDNLGAKATASKVITVSATTTTTTTTMTTSTAATQGLKVKSIVLAKTLSAGKYTVKATVTVTDLNGTLVSSAAVAGSFSGAVSKSVTGNTTSKGVVVLTAPTFVTNGAVTFTVTSLSKSGYTYSSANNVVTSATIQ